MSVSRRHFFYGSLLAGAVPTAGFGSVPSLSALGYKSPNEKLNIAAIGSGGKGYSDINGCLTENIVALTDPDDKRAERTFAQFPNLPKYKDFRRMFDSTSTRSTRCWCRVPTSCTARHRCGRWLVANMSIARSRWCARFGSAADAARGGEVQGCYADGQQGYSNDGARECAEIIWNGDIGGVTEVHAWTDRPGRYWPQSPEVEPKQEAVPGISIGGMARIGSGAALQPGLCAAQLARIPAVRLRRDRRYGLPHLGSPNMALRLSLTVRRAWSA